MPVEKRNPIPVKEAISRIMKQNVSIRTTKVDLDESLGHVTI